MPWPADYGGVIDIYSMIIALHKKGVLVHLHSFTTGNINSGKLEQYCKSIQFYPRKKMPSLSKALLPYIISTRISNQLKSNLQKDDYPILIGGIHCSYVLKMIPLNNRKIILRPLNVEHLYYDALCRNEKNIFKKIYFLLETLLLKKYEKTIATKLPLLCLSDWDKEYFVSQYKAKAAHFLPVFTGFTPEAAIGKGKYCLYQGNLAINENEKAARWLVKEVFFDLQIPLVIAGRNPSPALQKLIASNSYCTIIKDPSDEELSQIIKKAQLHVLPSFNTTGIKLKLIHALSKGRHCIVNNKAVKGSALESLCHIADEPIAFKECIKQLFNLEFTEEMFASRKRSMDLLYNNDKNVEQLMQWIY